MQPEPNPNPRSSPPPGSDPRFERVADPRIAAFGAPNAAKYRTMSPARLPISRSPCLTVPPGLSPGALLESPVLLTNMKAEPSPTTGTFSFHATLSDHFGSSSFCSTRENSRSSTQAEGASGDFEFKPHIRSSSRSGLSSLGPLASANSILQQDGGGRQIQSSQTQTSGYSQLVQADTTVHSSYATNLSMAASDPLTEASTEDANIPGENAPDEVQDINDSNNGMQTLQSDPGGSSPSTVVEKSSEDGYNWRKYGQKHVKGCEFPRSYYKCTHPNCQMKKQLERSHDGQITEIIYKGRHDHPKPEPTRRLAVGTVICGQGEERADRLSSLAAVEEKFSNERCIDPNGNTELSPVSVSDDDVDAGGVGTNHNGDDVADDDDPEAKRRKKDIASFDATQVAKTNREPRVVVQTVSEVDILDDGYRWRKYGQKVVKGNPNPRSYYKCTSAGCSVRKHVERASHDPKSVITTYEGKHNHDVPAARNSSHDTATPMTADGSNNLNRHMPTAGGGILRATYDTIAAAHRYPRTTDGTEMISLDLGVGITANLNSSAATEKLQQAPGIEQVQNHRMQQFVSTGFNRMAAQPAQGILYGSSSSGLYGSIEGKGEGFSFKTPSVNHSSEHYYPNAGNLVMGP